MSEKNSATSPAAQSSKIRMAREVYILCGCDRLFASAVLGIGLAQMDRLKQGKTGGRCKEIDHTVPSIETLKAFFHEHGHFDIEGHAAEEGTKARKEDGTKAQRKPKVADVAAAPEAEVIEAEPEQPKASDHKIGWSAADMKVVELEGEVRRLRTELKTALRDELTDQKVRKEIFGLANCPARIPTWLVDAKPGHNGLMEVPVTIWSDWHLGEVVKKGEINGLNEFNKDVAERRIRRLVERTIQLLYVQSRHADFPGMVINILGDIVGGSIHDELKKTNDLTPMEAVLWGRDMIVWGIKRLLEVVPRILVVGAAGNHGRNTKKPEFKGYVYDNFDWLLLNMVERYFKDTSDQRVEFAFNASNEVLYKVYDTRFYAMHGDMLGVAGGDGIIGAIGPIMRGEIKVRGSNSPVGREYDYLLLAHWHQTLWLPRCFVNNCLKGYDEYAKNKLRAGFSLPQQSLFFVHPEHGVTTKKEVLLEDGPAFDARDGWASVFKSAA